MYTKEGNSVKKWEKTPLYIKDAYYFLSEKLQPFEKDTEKVTTIRKKIQLFKKVSIL